MEVKLDKADELRDLGMASLSAGAALLSGGTPEQALAKAKESYYADELAAAKEAGKAEAAASQQSGLATWAKSTPGMLTLGAAAILLIVLVARK